MIIIILLENIINKVFSDKIIILSSLLFLVLSHFHAFCQSEKSIIECFEPHLFIGQSYWVNKDTNVIDRKRPSYQIDLSYSVNLNNKTQLHPYIGYSKIIFSNGENGIGFLKFYSLVAGSTITYKISNLRIGIDLDGNMIIKAEEEFTDLRGVIDDETFAWYHLFYNAGITLEYSFSHLSILALARFPLSGIKSIYANNTESLRINEYLIGVGYHL